MEDSQRGIEPVFPGSDTGNGPAPSLTAPMSYAQQRLWLLDRTGDGTATYNVRTALRLYGPLDVALLQASFDEVVRRHEILRTTFALVGAQPSQIIASNRRITLQCLDHAGLSAQERERRAAELLRSAATEPFDLANGPLLRATLVRYDANEHLLVIVLHHSVTDAASNAILRRELAEWYSALSEKRAPALADLPVQYADFAAWQRECAEDGALEEDLAYWRRRLADAPTRIELPARFTAELTPPKTRRDADPATGIDCADRANAGTVSCDLSPVLRDAAQSLGARENATLFMTFLATFNILLYRYTGTRDLVVGAPISERTRPELDGLIGCFLNTLALRTDIDSARTFRETLRRVRAVVLEAYEHGEAPFEKVIEAVHPARRSGATPLLNVMFVLHRAQAEQPSFGDVTADVVSAETATTNFDLTLHVVESVDGVRVSFQYDRSRVDDDMATQMLRHFERLFADAVARPDVPLSALVLLDDEERRRVLVEWNDTRVPYPADRTLDKLFEEQVLRDPHAIAVVAGNATTTYDELNEEANRLARALRDVAPGSVVAVACERSREMVAGVLAVLKADCTYLPLSASEPPERVAYMLADSAARAVLTQTRFAARFEGCGLPLHLLDDDAVGAASEHDLPHPSPSSNKRGKHSEAAAYVVYTSGSTGRPKGVLAPHRGVVRLVRDANYLQVAPSDVVAQLSAFSFDAFTFELWGALLNGARLEIVPRDVSLSPPDFADFLRERGISVAFLTTALFRQISRERPAAFKGLRALLVGGEVLDCASVNAVVAAGAPSAFTNVYGPTETTTFATFYPMRGEQRGTIPIGRPISNTQAYVLDDDCNVLPVGASGQLYLGGPGLALGYLGDANLTADKFISVDSCRLDGAAAERETGAATAPIPGGLARLYATGDVVRYRPDGNLEFLGRHDHQVKVNGFRVETGEIEAALRRRDGVQDAFVVWREDETGEKRLIAYIVAPSAATADTAEWRRRLAAELPHYMLPNCVVTVAALPLTAHGKVDAAALPDPHDEPLSHSGGARLTNPLHYQLVALWEKHLRVHPVGIHDSFFDLGGHSLLAARLIADIEQTLGKRIPLATLFDDPTIAHMSDVLVGDVRPETSPLVALRSEGSRPPFFFLHGDITGGGYYAREFGRYLGEDQPFYVLAPHGVDGRPLPPSIEAMAADYIAAIKAVRPCGPYVLGGHCSGGLVAFEMARQLEECGEDVRTLILIDASGRNGRLAPIAERVHSVAGALHLATGRRLAITQRAGRAARTMRRVRARSRDGMPALAGRAAKALATRMQTPRTTDAFGAWVAATAGYIPRRYGGRISLLMPTADLQSRRESLAGWRTVARAVDDYPIPGSHLTCITQHVQETAARVAECLRDEPKERLRTRAS